MPSSGSSLALARRKRLGAGACSRSQDRVGGIVLSFYRFYTSPMVFAFDPFFGFFAGTLYDSVITGLDRLVTYRWGTVATLVAAFAGSAVVTRTGGALSLDAANDGPALVVLLARRGTRQRDSFVRVRPALGHYQTTSTIRAALGQGRCLSGAVSSSIRRERRTSKRKHSRANAWVI